MSVSLSLDDDHTITIREALEPLGSPSVTKKQVTSAIKKITDLFNGLVNRPTTLCNPYNADLIEDLLEDNIGPLWMTIFDLVKKSPPKDQEPILSFLQQLQTKTIQCIYDPELQYHNMEIWEDLAGFGWVARDVFNFDVHNANATPEERQEWENITYFLAHLTVLDPSIKAFDFTLYALWILREAFESNEGDSEEAVKLAAIWINVAGERLKQLSEKHHDLVSRMGVAGPKYAQEHRDWVGFNEERWELWRSGFEKAKKSVKSKEVKELVVEALKVF
ncbi:hypothetical protein QBC38DRAFT_479886 [Podospora fimiseda]|uniref:Uncharacterized protein n=1 Tax=Podospora fimiseda TaxID=252190 RepID=A0AAN7BNH2_9PEZI|nr:hypothetical protein QBC38DRAFT_479886 [Podospora fimiseda]